MKIAGIRHGGHISAQNIDERNTTQFSYLFRDLATDPEATLPQGPETARRLFALGSSVGETPRDRPDLNSRIPPIMTYWGQFVDHDVTANTDRNSAAFDIQAQPLEVLSVDFVEENLRNLRRPFLDLDSLYGEGPNGGAASRAMFDGAKFRVGTVETGDGIPGVRIPPENDLQRDLPRLDEFRDVLTEDELRELFEDAEGDGPDRFQDPQVLRTPLIGDARNDENLIIAQLHVAMLRFHNAVVDWVEQRENLDGEALFRRAQQLTRWHYQWLTINDFLTQITFPSTLNSVLESLAGGGLKFFRPTNEVFMPLEHSVAAFRFGHSMVRGAYDFNRNFGQEQNVLPAAEFEQLFAFTGRGGFSTRPDVPGPNRLPFNRVIEFDRFTVNSPFPERFARKIDARLAVPLANLQNEELGTPPRPEIARHLARRNLLRGYLLSLPTGQAVASAMGERVLTPRDLLRDASEDVADALQTGEFLERTPLWFYILKEAEVRAFGESLGPVGSRIVAETFVGLVSADPKSYLNNGWRPADGVKLPGDRPIVTIADFIAFAGLPSGVSSLS